MPRARPPKVPPYIIDRLRLVCLDLPEAYEEAAWTGTRWMIHKRNFAHILMINEGWPPAYARVAQSAGPLCVLTFRSARPANEEPRFHRYPFFLPAWWPDIVGMSIDTGVDWEQVSELITDSYRALAPGKLVALLDD